MDPTIKKVAKILIKHLEHKVRDGHTSIESGLCYEVTVIKYHHLITEAEMNTFQIFLDEERYKFGGSLDKKYNRGCTVETGFWFWKPESINPRLNYLKKLVA